MKRLLLLSAGILCATPAVAQEPARSGNEPVHVVRHGDTLWELARRYLRDPFLWPEIFRENRGVVENPNRIYPAERLRIPGLEAGEAVTDAGTQPRSDRTVFYRPDGPGGGATFVAAVEEASVAVAPGEFRRAGRLMPVAELSTLGTLVEVLAPNALPTDARKQIVLFDRVYVRLAAGASLRRGDLLQLVRVGREVSPFGRVLHSTGQARVEAVERGVATLVVEEMYDRVSIGDLAVAAPEFPLRTGAVPQPVADLQGRLVAFEMPQPVPGAQDIAFVDLGRANGVQVGDEFAVLLAAEAERLGVQPVIVARLQVVKVTERTATARVVELRQPALRPGLPVRRVARMQ